MLSSIEQIQLGDMLQLDAEGVWSDSIQNCYCYVIAIDEKYVTASLNRRCGSIYIDNFHIYQGDVRYINYIQGIDV